MVKIKIGDPQPVDCPVCKEKHGYQVTDNVRGTYTVIQNADGTDDGGSYGDAMHTSFKSKKAFCSNCGTLLKLNIDRSDD